MGVSPSDTTPNYPTHSSKMSTARVISHRVPLVEGFIPLGEGRGWSGWGGETKLEVSARKHQAGGQPVCSPPPTRVGLVRGGELAPFCFLKGGEKAHNWDTPELTVR